MTAIGQVADARRTEYDALANQAAATDDRVSVVIVTRNRRSSLLVTLGHLCALPEQPPVFVIDNGSNDGTPEAVRQTFPDVQVIALRRNEGSAARNTGVRLARTPYVAFSDDDSWWAAGSLGRAADLLDAHPRLALIGARVLLGADGRPDPTCDEMAASPLASDPGLPGPAVLGFIACGAVVRRSAYLAAGGFHPRFGIGGEEELLAADLTARGWGLAYVDGVTAHHHPSPSRDPSRRRQVVTRNALWFAWLRRPPGSALRATYRALRAAPRDAAVLRGIAEAARGLPWVIAERRRLPEPVEAGLRVLEQAPPRSPAGMGAATGPPVDASGGGQASRSLLGTGAATTLDLFDVSVVVPTYKRDDLLRRCLDALMSQEFPRDRFEIIVVDDGRSASVPRLVGELAGQHPDLRLITLPGLGRGPATARNIGWRAARGEIIAFTDDDAYPADTQWLREGLTPFADARVAVVSDSVRVPASDPPTDFQRNVKNLESSRFLTCNAFCRRRALEMAGGFDERFTVPFREDSDLQFRLEANTGRLVRAEGARVIHPAPPGRFAVSLRLQRYSQFNALIYKKHRDRYGELNAGPPLHYYAMLGAAAGGVIAMLTGRRVAARMLATLWAGLEVRFFLRRARGTSRRPCHLLDLALTSLLIPPLSVYWRLRGAVRYRVVFG